MEWQNYPYQFDGLDNQLARINEKKAQLDALRPIPPITVKGLKDHLTLEWSYNSNGIEGNTLTLIETKLVVQDGLTISGKSLREHFEAINHNEAIEYVEGLISDSYKLSITDIKSLQHLVLMRIDKAYAGIFRTGNVRISGANFVPPDPLFVQEMMEELITWANDAENDLHILIKAAIYHHRFVWIHPFFDGNGRTVRLSYNLLLMKAGFPPAIILKNDRKKYYAALNEANNGHYGKLLLMVLQAAERSLDLYLSYLTNTNREYKPIDDIVSEPEIPYGQEYVSLLARRGLIDAFKEGRNWHTTKAAVLAYRDLRKRKR